MHNFSRPLSDVPRRTDPLAAYHVLSTEPYFIWNEEKAFQMREYEQLTAELSARLWRRYNGPIYLLTDKQGAAYVHEKGMDRFYDGIECSLDGRSYNIDLEKYWAFGKIQALLQIHAPCAIIDLDMLVWAPLGLSDCQVAAAHTEPVWEPLYPPFSSYLMSPRYSFPRQWDPVVIVLNGRNVKGTPMMQKESIPGGLYCATTIFISRLSLYLKTLKTVKQWQ